VIVTIYLPRIDFIKNRLLNKLIVMRNRLGTIIMEIHRKEDKLSTQYLRLIDEAYNMIIYLQNLLKTIKTDIIKGGFLNDSEEMNFFRNIKPQILGKLIYYQLWGWYYIRSVYYFIYHIGKQLLRYTSCGYTYSIPCIHGNNSHHYLRCILLT